MQYTVTAENIIFEDDILLVADKPAGLPSQGTDDPSKDHFYASLQRYLGVGKYLAIHHRLDSMTSGLMVFCKNKNFNKQVASLFSGHYIEKTYQAVVITGQQQLPTEWTVENQLKNVRRGRFLISKAVESGGQNAVTHFRLLEQKEGKALVECRPVTGRLHQIRVHLADYGTPVEGDLVYGKPSKSGRLMLNAQSLRFTHPKSRKKVDLKSRIELNWL